jgi:hypothetical protein
LRFIRGDIAVSSPAEVSAMAMSAGKREMDNILRLPARFAGKVNGRGIVQP